MSAPPSRRARFAAIAAVSGTIIAASLSSGLGESDAAPKLRSESQSALEEFNSLIGGWRGVGMPQRGSREGAWQEKAEWVWDFEPQEVAIQYKIEDGQLFTYARLTYDAKAKVYRLTAALPDKSERKYAGQLDDGNLVLQSEPDDAGDVYRMTVRRINDKRTVILHQKRQAGRTSFTRIAEVGYTREGTRLASGETSGPTCIVTGGGGTSKVTYQGKSYYVCCTGCRDAFRDDPEGILAAAKKRAEEKQREATKSP